MGRDKALVSFLGKPLIERIISLMQGIADEIIISTNKPAEFEFLGLPLFPDIRPGRGALGGLYTALSNASHPTVAVIACDMPFASPSLVTFQSQILAAEQMDVVIPLLPSGYEPLHAVYRRDTCINEVEWALDHDQWKLISWFPRVKVRALSPEECQPFDPRSLAFENVNTPQELANAEQLAI